MKRQLILLLGFLISFTIISAQEAKLMLPIGHTLGVSSAIFSPDGKRMVTSALDNTAKIWDIRSGMLLANLIGHTDTIRYANYSPDGKKIVTACEDGTAKIWDANSAELLVNIKGHKGMVYYAGFSPDGTRILTCSEDNTAKIWDVSNGNMLLDLRGHTQPVWECWYSLDGKRVITASVDSTAKVWDAITGKLLTDLRGHTNQVNSARISPDDKLVVTGSSDSTAKIWDANTGRLLFNLTGHADGVSFVSFSPDGKRVLTGSDDGHAKIWDAANGRVVFDLLGKKDKHPNIKDAYYPDVVTAAHFSPDGTKILTVYLDSSAKIWDASTGKLLKDLKRNYEYDNSASFSPDGKRFALALAWAHTEVWDIEAGAIVADLKGKANYVQDLSFSKDGKRWMLMTVNGSVKILDAATLAPVTVLRGKDPKGPGLFAYYSPDGKKIISYYNDNYVSVYDAVTGMLLFEINAGQGMAIGGFYDDAKKIITFGQDSTIGMWDGGSGKLIFKIHAKAPWPSPIYSISRNRLYVNYYSSGTFEIFEALTGKKIGEVQAHDQPILNMQLNNDGSKLITTSKDSSVKVWDTESGKLVYAIKDSGRALRSAWLSPDGKKILATLTERIHGTVITKIYDFETGKFIRELNQEGFNPDFFNVNFTQNGKQLYSGMTDGSFKVWDAETGEIIKNFKGLKRSPGRADERLSEDEKEIILSEEDGTIRFFSFETGSLIRELKGHSLTAYNIKYTPDKKRIIATSGDNTVKIWDAETGSELLTLVPVGADDYLVVDKFNHFDGSEAARKTLYFTCGTEPIELDQVKDQLWIPNLAERVLAGETINSVKLSDLNICNLTPLVDSIEGSALQYRFRITPRLGGLGTTIVYVNGIEVTRYTPQQLQLQKGDYYLSINKNDLHKYFVSNKENTITVKSLTAKSSISSRALSISEKKAEMDLSPPNLYAVVVGISDYKGNDLDLKFAAKDAIDIGNAIDLSAKKLLDADGKRHVFIYKINTGIGRDRFPEKNSIKTAFSEIAAKSKPNDILLVFFAGHGVMESEKNKFYFLTADASDATVTGALKDVGISTDELSDWIKPQVMKAQKRILIFDACNSGQAVKELAGIGQDGQNLLASRGGDDKEKQIKAIEKLNERSGMFILSASASNQKAYEMGKYSQGVLTYSLLKAIKEEPDILEDRKYLNISRWFDAAEKTVRELARETGARQQPQLVSTTNFNVGVVDDEVRAGITLPFEKPLFTRSDFRNSDLRIDNLKLRNAVDKSLGVISDNNSNASILFNLDYDGANVYSISGDYKVNGSEITASIILARGGTEIVNHFEVKGTAENINSMAETITDKVVEWLGKKNSLLQ